MRIAVCRVLNFAGSDTIVGVAANDTQSNETVGKPMKTLIRFVIRYCVSLLIVACFIAIRWNLDPWLGTTYPLALFYSVIAVSAWIGGYKGAVASTVITYFTAKYLFIEPRGELLPTSVGNSFGAGLFFFNCGVIVFPIELFRRALIRSKQEHQIRIADIQQAKVALLQADQRKDEFLATLAHELRNPLAPIGYGLEVLRTAREDPKAIERVRTLMQRQYEQMSHLVNDLIDLSRISNSGVISFRCERLELNWIIRQAIESCRHEIERRKHTLKIDLPSEPTYMNGDEVRLIQVFTNLLNNAARYTNPGGTIAVSSRLDGDEVVIAVSDDGIGIPIGMSGNVFDAFNHVRRLQGVQDGLGIGLSIVKRLVELHGGKIEAHSGGHAKGSEFVVRLPFISVAAIEESTEPKPNSPVHRRILVVDDEQDIVDSCAMMLLLQGHEVETALDGPTAIKLAASFKPELIMLDVGMPGMDGLETARRIREQPWSRDMVLIAVTGWGQELHRQQSREARIDRHFVKPIDIEQLRQILDELPSPHG
jgi:signal transduction histidine kinase